MHSTHTLVHKYTMCTLRGNMDIMHTTYERTVHRYQRGHHTVSAIRIPPSLSPPTQPDKFVS